MADKISRKVQTTLAKAIYGGLFLTLTAIRTRYEDDGYEYSGVGLLMSYGDDRVYCLTANHVLNPQTRRPPRHTPVIAHYHSVRLQEGVDTNSILLRRKSYNGKQLDLAIAESCLSGSPVGTRYQEKLYEFDSLDAAGEFIPEYDDVLAIAGLPTQQLMEIPALRISNHTPLFHFFRGSDVQEGDQRRHLYNVPYQFDVSPSGMSGSPVWVIRQQGVAAPLDLDYVLKEEASTMQLAVNFAGIVVDYYPDPDSMLGVVKPEACARFVANAEPRLLELRDAKEDERIVDQLGMPDSQKP